MDYFFDESGNWIDMEKEKRFLVLAGMLVKEKEILNKMNQDFEIFKATNKLKIIHAYELSNMQIQELYQLIDKYLSSNSVKVLAFIIEPKIFFSQTQRDPDEIYIDIASNLIAKMTFFDSNINIEYDMKFHYAYASNILQEIKTFDNNFDEYVQMAKNFDIKQNKINFIKKRIKSNILKDKNLVKFNLDRLNDTTFLQKYLWSEFKLKTKEAALRREQLKTKAEQLIKLNAKKFNLSIDNMKIKIVYKNKYKQSAGVQIIDIINNFLWKYALKTPPISKEYERAIYNKIEIKEILNG